MSKKRIFILTNSSLNNSISNLLWISKFEFTDNDKLIILNFEKYSKKQSIPIKQLYKINFKRNYIVFLDSKNIFSKFINYIILIIFINFLNLAKLIKKDSPELIIIQPRYRWLVERFKNLGKFFPEFKTILVGDGLGSECLRDVPFWIKSNMNYSRIKKEELLYSYFLYDTEKCINNKKKFNRIKYSSQEFLKIINYTETHLSNFFEYSEIYKYIDNISEKYERIFIFTTTTFYEYKRTTLDSEINLYSNFIDLFLRKYKYNNKKDFIFIKLHPKTSSKKIYKIIEIFSNKNLINFSNIKNINSFISFPIELILSRFINKKKKEVFISGLSTAIVPSSFLIDKKNIELGFGKKLILTYFDKDNGKIRLDQERIISEIIENNNS